MIITNEKAELAIINKIRRWTKGKKVTKDKLRQFLNRLEREEISICSLFYNYFKEAPIKEEYESDITTPGYYEKYEENET